MAPSMHDLERRIALLEAERAILGTLYQYGHTLDYGAETEWLDCFTSDAILEFDYRPGLNGESVRYEGRQRLTEFVTNHTRAPERFHKHLLVEPVVVVEGTGASVTSFYLRVDADGDERHIYAFGRYVDRLVRCADDRWRLASRRVEIEARRRERAPSRHS